MPKFYHEIAAAFGGNLDDDMISAIEGACITQAEWESQPGMCAMRVRGALEEMGGMD